MERDEALRAVAQRWINPYVSEVPPMKCHSRRPDLSKPLQYETEYARCAHLAADEVAEEIGDATAWKDFRLARHGPAEPIEQVRTSRGTRKRIVRRHLKATFEIGNGDAAQACHV